MLSENFAYPKLMRYFEEISAIPRATYKEQKIADYLVSFAEARGLEVRRDSVHNVLINLPATPDCVDLEPILLQGHTDMVCEKNAGVEHDFDRDPLKLYEKDGWIRAKDTTLGADNGVAVAVMLAILDGAAESHPALQCLFTVSEEVGMDGVKALDFDWIYARKMINMDSADERCVIAGCAGGLRSQINIPVTREKTDLPCLRLRVGGLCGGHSGEDIAKGRTNALKVLGYTLWELFQNHSELRLISVKGGGKENAIPREAEAVFCVADTENVRKEIEELRQKVVESLSHADEGFFITIEQDCLCDVPMDLSSTQKVIFFMETVAVGVFAMNRVLPEIVEFSRNLGILSTSDDSVAFVFSSRSAIESQIDRSQSELDAYAKMLGGTSLHYNRYPGWNFAENSPIRDAYVEAYRTLFGGEVKIEVIHAGLECGLIKEKVPDMDLISCGPLVVNLHSPDEALHKESFGRFFALILELLRAK